MQEVNIYINVSHTGHLKKGKGAYSIVLEFYNSSGNMITREYIDGLKNTTLNRVTIKACIAALEYLIKQCKVNLTINSEHVVRAVNEGRWIQWIDTGKNAKGQPAKNMDLWQLLLEQVDKHDVIFNYAETNPYTAYMSNQIRKTDIDYKEDEGNV